jgi:hypothetical protein
VHSSGCCGSIADMKLTSSVVLLGILHAAEILRMSVSMLPSIFVMTVSGFKFVNTAVN